MAVLKKKKTKEKVKKSRSLKDGIRRDFVKSKKLSPKKKNIRVVKKVAKSHISKDGAWHDFAKPKSKKVIVKKSRGKKVLKKKIKSLVQRYENNPIMGPARDSFWESEAVFNPAVVLHDARVHLFYRALGGDGMSRIGYATSKDGLNFDERLSYPVFVAENVEDAKNHHPFTSPARLTYDTTLYASGGGWGGCEDPRAVIIDGRLYLTFNMFNGWDSMRVAYTSLDAKNLVNKKWVWSQFNYLSRPGDRQKNWVLFPEKFDGKFALFHNLDKGDPTRVHIAYVDELNMYQTPNQREAPDPQILPDHIVTWHNRTRSASAPPIKTKDGWLLFYHAMDKDDPNRYKVGVLLLDLKDPTKVLYRSSHPILSPDEWYENDWKPGIIYASGAIIKDGILFLYYGGGDKRIAVAYAKLGDFIHQLKSGDNVVLSKKTIKL